MEQIVPWLALKSVPGIGNLMFNRLVGDIGSPHAVLQASPRRLSRVSGMTPSLVQTIRGYRCPDWVFIEIERCVKKGFRIITQTNPDYPALLLHIPDPPPLLYCYGALAADQCHIAVVGARKATAYGTINAKSLAGELAAKGIGVVSGMARGIDTAAHIGAMEGGGRTVAVLGSGLECVYPSENLKLFHRIAENGAVISEFPLDARPEPHHFPQRNRIISGMALGTVVVEAADRSGSLITARLAAEQGREVFAVPGSIHAATAQGTHSLIRQGAKLVENAGDVIEEIAPQLSAAPDPGSFPPCPEAPERGLLSAEESRLLEAMGPYPVHIDELARRCNLEMGPVCAILVQLELKGIVVQEPGKFFHAIPMEKIDRAK
ncbi:MAG: DNA-processing protein DprA [Desulfobacteraceae bacterium]|jgi:DNA processing protein